MLFAAVVWGLQKSDSRKLFQERPNIIAQFAIGDPGVSQDVTGENVEIELRRNPEVASLRQDRVHQARGIENEIAAFRISKQIDQRNVLVLGAGQSADNKVKICCRKARPTIRLNHRGPIISTRSAICKHKLGIETAHAPMGIVALPAEAKPGVYRPSLTLARFASTVGDHHYKNRVVNPKPTKRAGSSSFLRPNQGFNLGGRGGIRTHGGLPHARFRVECLKPDSATLPTINRHYLARWALCKTDAK